MLTHQSCQATIPLNFRQENPTPTGLEICQNPRFPAGNEEKSRPDPTADAKNWDPCREPHKAPGSRVCSSVPDGLAACMHAWFSIGCPPWIHDLMDVSDIRVSGNL